MRSRRRSSARTDRTASGSSMPGCDAHRSSRGSRTRRLYAAAARARTAGWRCRTSCFPRRTARCRPGSSRDRAGAVRARALGRDRARDRRDRRRSVGACWAARPTSPALGRTSPRCAPLATLVVEVLATARGVGSDRLDVPVGVRADPDFLPRGRDHQVFNALQGRCIGDWGAIWICGRRTACPRRTRRSPGPRTTLGAALEVACLASDHGGVCARGP